MIRNLLEEGSAAGGRSLPIVWRRLQCVGLLLLPIVYCSCRNVDVIPVEKGRKFPATDPAKVKVEYDAPTAAKYIVIADLAANGSSEWVIRKKAAELGADEVIVRKIGAETSSAKHRIFGTAIKYQ
jgi:hypothetical protein